MNKDYFFMCYYSIRTLFIKETLRFLRIWPQTIVPAIVTSFLYFVIFGSFIGSQLNDINGISYIAFIVPGLIMLQVIMNSYMNVVSSFFFFKFQKSIEEILVSPMPAWAILLGFVGAGISRGFFVGLGVTIVSLLFVRIQIYSFWIVFAIFLISSMLFSLGGLINGIYAKKFDDMMIIPNFVLTPLIYLGGVFYSIGMLSGIWQTISLFNPLLYIINIFRYGFLGISDVNVFYSFVILLVFVFLLYIWAYMLIKKGYNIRV